MKNRLSNTILPALALLVLAFSTEQKAMPVIQPRVLQDTYRAMLAPKARGAVQVWYSKEEFPQLAHVALVHGSDEIWIGIMSELLEKGVGVTGDVGHGTYSVSVAKDNESLARTILQRSTWMNDGHVTILPE